MTRSRGAGFDFPWTAGVAALAVLATGLASRNGMFSADAAAIRSGQLWRLVTGPFIHATTGHLVRDLALCLAIGAAYERPLRRVWPLLIASGLIVPTAAAMATGWSGYLGLSGLSHAFIAAAIVCELRRRRRPAWYVLVAAAGLALKVAIEVALDAPLFRMNLGPDVAQAPIAHAAGALTGIVAALAASLRRPKVEQAVGHGQVLHGNPSRVHSAM